MCIRDRGCRADIEAMENAIYCGCRILATVHGSSLSDIQQKPLFSNLMQKEIFDRYIILDARRGPGTVREIRDRKGKILCSNWQEPV